MYEIKEITSEQSSKIIEDMNNEKNYGLFYVTNEDGSFTGIDNSDGDAWTEDFKNKDKLFAWLRDDEED